MPRTVPDISVATPNIFQVSLFWIDGTGDYGSDVLSFTSAPSFGNIEAFVAAYATSQNVNIYDVEYKQRWKSARDVSDATMALRHSGKHVIHAVAMNAAGDAEDIYLRAPIEASFVANTDNPDPAATALAATLAAWVNMLPAGYSLNSLRFAGHVEKNKKVLV